MRIQSIFLLALSVLLLTACGGGKSPNTALPQPSDAQPETITVKEGKFTLNVSPDSFVFGGSADSFSLNVLTEDEATVVEVHAEGAKALKALYLDLAYPHGELSPKGAELADGFAKGKDVIDLTITGEADRLHHGQVFVHPESADGFSGSGALARFEFSNEASAGNTEPAAAFSAGKQVSIAPRGKGSRSDIGHVSGTTYGVFWHYYNQGDYDQNTEVNISDLTPLAIHFGKSGPLNPASLEGIADGDANGEINISDLTPIAANFGARVSGFNVYASDNIEDYPVDGGISTIEPYTTKEFADYQTPESDFHLGPLPKDGRPFYWADAPKDGFMILNFNYYWVRPTDGTDEGLPSYCLAGVMDGSSGSNLPIPSVEGTELSPFNPTNPFIAEPGSQYQVEIMHPEDGNIATSPDISYRIVNYYGFPVPGASMDKSTGTLSFSNDVPTDEVIVLQYFYKYRSYGQGLFGVPFPDIQSQNTNGGQGQDPPSGMHFKLNGPVQAPVSELTATVYEGPAPLTVTLDASGTTDPDDSIESLTFFWSPGTFDGGPWSGPMAEVIYTEPNVYKATVTARDPWYANSSSSVVIRVLPAAGQPPKAVLSVDDGYFNVPQEVNFSAAASLAAPGRTIVKYEWDLDGNGSFEEDTGDVPFASQLYGVPKNTFSASVRITDNEGDMDETSWPITALPTANDLPVIDLVISATSGSSPLTVNFDASGTTDPDGTIENIFWDMDFDGESEGDPGPTREFTYTTGGAIRGQVFAIDNDGGAGIEVFVIRVDDPPVAALNTDTNLYFPPAMVEFDASGSTDANGTIVEYRWDFDGDGTDDLTTTEPMASHEYLAGPGVFVRLTVVDNEGLTDYVDSFRSIF